jgi:hypothetical protein
MITVAILGILAAILLPQLSSDIPERLEAAAQIVATDLDYARGLAVTNNSQYRFTFEPDDNRYYLEHSGANNLLDVLPASPFRQQDDQPDRQTTELADLPFPEPVVRLLGVVQMAGAGQAATEIEFAPLGGTSTSFSSVVWLACGFDDNQRYIPIEVNPVTGLASVGSLVTELPGGTAVALGID